MTHQVTLRPLANGLIVADVTNALATASISLQGGHVLSWQPVSTAHPVLWMSPMSAVTPGKAFRGGIPVCWPWFGPHEQQADLPAHGYARAAPWSLTQTDQLNNGSTQLKLELDENEQAPGKLPARLALQVTIGRTLQLALTTHNRSAEPLIISEALHSYFQIGDIAQVQVSGLEGVEFIDKVRNGMRERQAGPIHFTAETDRVYANTTADCQLDDPSLSRRIKVSKTGSQSTVIWTPWAEKAGKMADIGADHWRSMVCVESANALENQISIPINGSHTLTVEYAVENL
jgi:glucose-6-phosphate 1-epimerase